MTDLTCCRQDDLMRSLCNTLAFAQKAWLDLPYHEPSSRLVEPLFVPIKQDLIGVTSVHTADPVVFLLVEVTKEPGNWLHCLVVNVAFHGLR